MTYGNITGTYCSWRNMIMKLFWLLDKPQKLTRRQRRERRMDQKKAEMEYRKKMEVFRKHCILKRNLEKKFSVCFVVEFFVFSIFRVKKARSHRGILKIFISWCWHSLYFTQTICFIIHYHLCKSKSAVLCVFITIKYF